MAETEEERREAYLEELIECPFCGGYVPNEFECILCEEELLESEMETRKKTVCSYCNEDVDETDDECPRCGAIFAY